MIMVITRQKWMRPLKRRAAHFRAKLGLQCLVNAVLFAGLAAAGVWWAYPLLWLVPLLTWMMVITRIRNIAEHALVARDEPDPLRQARTTHAGLLERALLAPYWVNHHLEHHLFTQVPCWKLPQAHALLRQRGVTARMELQPGYAQVLRLATAA